MRDPDVLMLFDLLQKILEQLVKMNERIEEIENSIDRIDIPLDADGDIRVSKRRD